MKKILYSLLLLMLLLAPVAPAYAQGGNQGDGKVIIGQDFTLRSGETLKGDLVVIGGAVIIEENAIVNGNVGVIGGSLKMDGKATGDAVVIGGVVAMGEQAAVAGDLVTVGGTLQRAEGSKVGGNVVTNLPPPSLKLPVSPRVPNAEIPPIPPSPGVNFDFGAVGSAVGVVVWALLLAGLAMLLTLFLHPQLDRVAQAVTRQPFVSGSIGLLTAIVAPIAVIILAVTILLIPVALAAVILLALAWLFGVVALGMEVGDRFTKAIHRTWEPVLSTGAGTFLLGLAVGLVNQVPCVGWLAPIIVGLVGLGAAVSTLFGTRPLAPALLAPPPPPVSGTEEPIPPTA
jgi:hypothetical protein